MGQGNTKVTSEWNASGHLVFKDEDGTVIATFGKGANAFVSDVTGDVTGAIQHTVEAAAADGAVAIASKEVIITKAGVAALTLADPTATTHDGVRIRFIAGTANAHTVDNSAGSGFNGGGAGADVGTFGGAVGDLLEVVAYQGVWYVTANVNVTLA